jgi:hypothetical protein
MRYRRSLLVSWRGHSAVLCAAGVFALSAAHGATPYVDGALANSCKQTYSIARRDASGNDGDAFKTIGEAANAARAGDVVLIRGGSYHTSINKRENDVLWPKNSGEAGKPIVFKAYQDEQVVLGEGAESYPSEEISIARGVVSLKDLSYISFENLHLKKLAGWVFARNCDHLVFQNCVFEDSLWKAKGTARFVECRDCRFLSCSFNRSSFDSLTIEKCERMLIENCTFDCAAHALLAIRGSSFNVVRNCSFKNPYFVRQRSEKLVEVYDLKLDPRSPANPAYVGTPAYNSTKRNLFEYNLFGYHPARPKRAAQPSAIQYSGQAGIIRRNIFANPPLNPPDPANPEAVAGGIALAMRWGGSWDGWRGKPDGTGRWWGEGHEAGYVTQNRVYHNVFFGYDYACIGLPREDATAKMLNPPPMEEKNPPRQFTEKFAFEDNRFLNNIIAPGPYQPQTTWKWQAIVAGKPVAVVMFGLLDRFSFRSNDFYASNNTEEARLYYEARKGKGRKQLLIPASRADAELGKAFGMNRTDSPEFVDAPNGNFQLSAESPLIDAGGFLTTAIGSGTESTQLRVKDPVFFYDGFGIEGETGDTIQFQGQAVTARIKQVDLKSGLLTIDHPLSWSDGQEITLAYQGKGPDIGALEWGVSTTIGRIEAAVSEH